jgi:hypothetical protein
MLGTLSCTSPFQSIIIKAQSIVQDLTLPQSNFLYSNETSNVKYFPTNLAQFTLHYDWNGIGGYVSR